MNAGSICLSRYLGHYSLSFKKNEKAFLLKKKCIHIFASFEEKYTCSLFPNEADKAQITMLIQILRGTCNHPEFPATPTHCHSEHLLCTLSTLNNGPATLTSVGRVHFFSWLMHSKW